MSGGLPSQELYKKQKGGPKMPVGIFGGRTTLIVACVLPKAEEQPHILFSQGLTSV